MTRVPVLVAVLAPFVAACARAPAAVSATPVACTFTNPISRGADPWVVRRGDAYFMAQSRNDGIYVSRSDRLTTATAHAVKVWTPMTGSDLRPPRLGNSWTTARQP